MAVCRCHTSNEQIPGGLSGNNYAEWVHAILITQKKSADMNIAPAKLDPMLMKEPRVIQGVPRANTAKARRKPIPSMLGPNGRLNGLAQSPPE